MKMETIKINIEVSLSKAMQDFLQDVFNYVKSGTTTSEVIEPGAAKSATPASTPVPTIPQPAKPAIAETSAEPAPSAPAVPAASSASDKPRKIEEVRKVLAQKVNEHRDVIKQKLNELGAPSVTKLDPSKYNEMYDFLVNL